MRLAGRFFVFLAITLLTIIGCHDLGHVEGPGDYGRLAKSVEVVGEVRYIDTQARKIEVRTDQGRTWSVRYDYDTRVIYRQREYAVTDLERGDHIAMRVRRQRDGGYYTDFVAVRESFQERADRGAGSDLQGVVLRNDPRYNSMTIEKDDRRQASFYYETQTKVRYRNRDYPIQSIKPGDYLAVWGRPSDRLPHPIAEYIVVRAKAGEYTGPGSAGLLERYEGTVEYIDERREQFDVRDRSNRLVVVSLQDRAGRTVSDRFNRLRKGDYVRLEGRFVTEIRFDLESFQ